MMYAFPYSYLSATLTLLVLFGASLGQQTVSAIRCGEWFSHECLCETDIRYCEVDPSIDDILNQNPLWADLQGYYSYESTTFGLGGTKITGTYAGYLNHTIQGSVDYQHRYFVSPIIDPAICGTSEEPFLGVGFQLDDYVCGETGAGGVFEGWSTSTFERDGTLTSATTLNPDLNFPADDEDLYLTVPMNVNDGAVYGSAVIYSSEDRASKYFVTHTWVFTNEVRTTATAVQDVYFFFNDQTYLVQSERQVYTKLPNATVFTDMILADYDEYNVSPTGRYSVPMTTHCLKYPDCPTVDALCEADPQCGPSTKSIYQEPNGNVKAGVIAGFLIAGFVLMGAAGFFWHRHILAKQQARNRNQFARRIAETINLTRTTRQVTPAALVKEFDIIDGKTQDGFITKEDLWEFIGSGKAGELDERDFNALFSAIDLDGNGKVDFLEFCAFMGKCDLEFEEMKRRPSVMQSRPSFSTIVAADRHSFKNTAASRISSRSISFNHLDSIPDFDETLLKDDTLTPNGTGDDNQDFDDGQVGMSIE